MNLTTRHAIGFEYIVWAVYKLYFIHEKLPTKAQTVFYLKMQIELFGDDWVSLVGSNYDDEVFDEPMVFVMCKNHAAKKFPKEVDK